MSRELSVTHALIAVMLAAAPGAVAQVTSNPDTGAKSPWPTVNQTPNWGEDGSSDSSFIHQAIRGNYTEVALGRLAESRASSSEVKDFAERMVSDHNDMNKEWVDLAHDKDMKVTVDFGQSGQQTIDRLEELSGSAFDQAYMSAAIRQHEQDLAAFQRMGTSARSNDVRELANSGVSTIREHLALAQQVGSRVGVSSTAGRAGGVPPSPSDSDRTRRTNGPEDRGTLNGEDRAFVQNVLQDHLMHIQLAQLARSEAKRDETRLLAENMEDEFQQWQQRWTSLAGRYGVKPPSHLGTHHREKVERLEAASKRNVDRTYTQIVAEHLESVVPYFEKEGQAVHSAPVRQLVKEELPVIRQIVAGVRGMQGKTGVPEEGSDRR